MKNVAIIVPQGEFILSSLIGTFKAFSGANAYMVQIGKDPVFKVQLVGLDRNAHLYNGLFSIHPDVLLNDAATPDLLIIPASAPQCLAQNEAFIPWVLSQYKQGAEVASLCTGAFMLASTGLLKGKQCSTHWMAAPAFRQQFPDVNLVTEKVITDQDGLYTSGGAYSFLNLVMHLIEKYCGRHVAIYLAKVMEIEIERKNQSQFSIFQGQKEHEDEPIREAQTYIERNVGEKISIDQLATRFAISRRNFERRFKKATSNTPVEYLQRVKMEAAKKSLESGRENVNEVMYAVGYSDSKAFRTVFKKVTGLSPLEYRKKYNREMAF